MIGRENMSNVEKARALLDTKERLPANLKEYDRQRDQAFMEHNSVERSREEADYIGTILLSDMELETEERLTEKDRFHLSNRQSLDYANILLNSNKKSDSPEMKNVKTDVANLANVLESKMAEPLTAEGFDSIEAAFAMAIKSLKSYLDTKNPHFKTGIERKRQVHELWTSLMYESLMFSKQRAYLRPDHEGGIPASFAELFGVKGNLDTSVIRPEKLATEGPAVMPANYRETSAFFKADYSFAEAIKAKYSKPKDILSKGNEVMAFYNAAKNFTPGAVQLADVKLMGKTVTLLQKSDNSLYLVQNHKEYPLGRSLSTMIYSIEKEIFANPEVYGKQHILNLLDKFESPDYQSKMNSGENNRIRTMLQTFLSKKTGLAENDFTNTFRRDMVTFIRQYLSEDMTGEQIKARILEQAGNTVFVNGVAVSEMAQLNAGKSRDEIKKMVLFEKVDEPEVISDGWTPEEVHVKNMIADLIYTTDTENMDISVVNPGEFVRKMLEKHKDALSALIAHKNDASDYVKEILKKMSIADLSGEIDGHQINLDGIIANSINALRDLKEAAGEGGISAENLANIKRNLDDVVDKSCMILQANVGVMSGVLFPEADEQKNQQNKSLRRRVADAAKSKKGQGKFMRNVFNSYFGKVSNIDKRAMLASVFRSAKNVRPVEYTNEELIAEIKKKKITRYPSLLAKEGEKGEDRKEHYNFTGEELALLDDYREYKKTMRIQANFLGGLIRGAGPLMHKMLQGISTEGFPEEIKQALKDVKTNLPPIPENLVRSELIALVESSNGNITKIEVVKSLGAASVGQAFLCKAYGPSGDMKKGKEVVIKLLRPEAKNRMQREEKIMLDAARDTDEAMYLTYKGQLNNYKRELDLSIEADNCKQGVLTYEGKGALPDVRSMKTQDGVPASSTALVIEKAPGVTLDNYLAELKEYPDLLLKDFYGQYRKKDGTIEINDHEIIAFTPEKIGQLAEKKRLILDKIDEAVKRRDHILNLCNIWIDKALMDRECGFYHGDLHSGNIIINDKEAVFIDYGNTVQLSDTQQKALVKMALASNCSVAQQASSVPTDLFFESFNDLIVENNDPEFMAIYTEDKKRQLKEAFAEILHLGKENEAGYRISLCIAKAQELGVMIPPVLQNFSQGQIRLQNTIQEMNESIEKMKMKVDNIDQAGADYDSYDPVAYVKSKIVNARPYGEKFKGSIKSILPADEEGFKKGILDNTVVKADLAQGIKGVDKRKEFRQEFFGSYTKLLEYSPYNPGERLIPAVEFQKMGLGIEQIGELGYDTSALNPQEKTYRQVFEDYMEKYKDSKGSPEQLGEANSIWTDMLPGTALFSNCLDAFGGQAFFAPKCLKAVAEMDREAMNELFDIFENKVAKSVLLVNKVDKFWAKLDDRNKKMTREQKDAEIDELYSAYNQLHSEFAKKNEVFIEFENNLDRAGMEDKMERDLAPMFAITQSGIGKRLRKKFDAYRAFKDKYPLQQDPDGRKVWKVGEEDRLAYAKAKKELCDVYYEASLVRLKDYSDKMFTRDINVKYVDYDSVLEAVIKKNFPHEGFLQKAGSAGKLSKWLGMKTLEMLMSGM